MSVRDYVVVVLAAGKGTRLKSGLAKVLHSAGGRALVSHVIRAAQVLEPRAIICVVGHQGDLVRAIVGPLDVECVLQEPQNGTGHAMQVAREAIGNRGRQALVVPGDAPLVRPETLAGLLRFHVQGRAAATILSAVLEDPTGYGRIIRKGDETVAAIVEEGAATPEQRAIREVNSSIYAFDLEKLWPCLERLRPENIHRELYLTDAIALLNAGGEKVLAEVAPDPREILGCNTRAELAEVDRVFRQRKRAALMDSGVTIQLPETVLVDPDVEIGPDTLIEPGVQLLGRTRIASGCIVRTGSVLTDAVLEKGVEVRQHCVIAASKLSAGAVVGPFAHLRDHAELLPGARVGNFVEVKKSTLGEGVKAMHLAYLGDSSIGAKTNIGAGTITCNFDGVQKNRTDIGENVFIGSNSALIAPIKIGDRAYVAAGSTITRDVPADALGIARGMQEIKEGWAARRREKLAEAAANAAHPEEQPPRRPARRARAAKRSRR
jgi:bifunctional UDP-N-acetylglucosamine pyrophosphorylase/glucosamine-1-phosphate N-acetyltransferase